MKRKLFNLLAITGTIISLSSCEKDTAVVIPPPSEGETIALNGGSGGATATNSVFLDLSSDKQDSVKRTAWDLAFYCGADFKVMINNTTGATAKALTKTDITQVVTADTAGFSSILVLGQGLGTMSIIDDVEGTLNNTVIAPISSTNDQNYVYIVRPTNGSVSSNKDWYKLRIIKNGSGYRIQYAKLSETTIKTIDIIKDVAYNFKYFSFDDNALVNVEPQKANWDIEWTLTTYKASPTIPYTFSDFIYINSLAGVQAAEKISAASIALTAAEVRNAAYANYNEDSIATTIFSSSKVVIGSNWRATTGAVGVKIDRFYVIKDAAGNVYKLKFISFTTQDGGERGKPVIEYKLVKKA